MKRLVLPLLLSILATQVMAQEGTADLSKKARKGFITEVTHNNGNYQVTYKMAGDKKKDAVTYETYNFDSKLQFVNSEQSSEPKLTSNDKPDRTIDFISAQVGGCSSFDVLSMKLRFNQKKVRQKWNYKKQYYVTDDVLSNETFKPKSEDIGALTGYAAYNGPDDGSLFVLAGSQNKEDKKATQFIILSAKAGGDITQKPVDIQGHQSLVYSDQLSNGDVVLVFAPDDGSPDLTAYTYMRFAPDGTQKDKVPFKSPSPNMLIMAVSEHDNSVFFCGTSTKKDDAYNRVFCDYAADINNPCYDGGANKLDEKWTKKSEGKMANFHLLKFTGNQLDFASTEPISNFEDKLKAAPGEKHPDAYEGRKFAVENFTVTPQGEYLIAGQLTGKVKTGSSKAIVISKSYEDLVCLHFDKDGHLKAQYASNKMNTDKKSEIFSMNQSFVPSQDGKSLYWVILEVKGTKGYADFFDAYNDLPTFYARYFPRIAKLDPTTTTLGAFKVLGDEDYYISNSVSPITDAAEHSITYIGSDEDRKKVWLAKYIFE